MEHEEFDLLGPDVSVLRPVPFTPVVAGKTIAGILLFLLALAVFFYFIRQTTPAAGTALIYIFIALATAAIIGLTWYLRNTAREAENGYLIVDSEKMKWWEARGEITIPMSRLLGSKLRNDSGQHSIRFYTTSDNDRRFSRTSRDFRKYRPYAGPVFTSNYQDSKDGNLCANYAVLFHVQERIKKGLSMAPPPVFRFQARKAPMSFLRDDISCDGYNLICHTAKAGEVSIPVWGILTTSVYKRTHNGMLTDYDLTLTLDPACGCSEVRINLLGMGNAEEITDYCECLSSLFLRPSRKK